jgi:hypothetical protein
MEITCQFFNMVVVTKVTVRHKGVLIESTEYKQLHKVNKIHTNLLVEKNRIPRGYNCEDQTISLCKT